MWEGKTGRIQSFNQAKKFTIMKKGTCNFHCLYCDTLPVSCCFTYSCRTLLKTFFFFKRQILNSPHVRESGKFLLKKSEILGFEIRNTVQRIRNLTNDWNPEFKFPLTKTGIQYLESGIQDCLGFPYMERVEFTCQPRFPRKYNALTLTHVAYTCCYLLLMTYELKAQLSRVSREPW